jgi:methylase of polypeptide subunit release factors
MLNALEERLYDGGKRLIPHRTHDDSELIRHRSSYAFCHGAISRDAELLPVDSCSIVDIGFGTGYGCALLSCIPNSSVIGVDGCRDCESYARLAYQHANID